MWLQALEQKHSKMLASGKAPQIAAAQTAEVACGAVKARLTHKTGMPWRLSCLTFVVLSCCRYPGRRILRIQMQALVYFLFEGVVCLQQDGLAWPSWELVCWLEAH